MISLALLEMPRVEKGRKIIKGAMILSDVDIVLEKYPKLKDYFYLIERRGWEGINISKNADIKLVEDSSVWNETQKRFPRAILLDLAGADFVDTERFKPMNSRKEYTGIQISTWQPFKRPELFFEGIRLLPEKKFLKFGHLIYKNKKEFNYKKRFALFVKRNNLNVDLPYANLKTNKRLPGKSEQINKMINKAKIGILTSNVEGINRFKLECLSANIPVLVPIDANVPLKKHINSQTGFLYEPTPRGLAEAIIKVEKSYKSFFPRKYVLKHTGNKKSVEKLKKALRQLSKRDGNKYIYQGINWDGRNQSLIWDKKAIKFIDKILKSIQNEINNS